MAYWYRHPNSGNQKKGKYTILYTDIFQIKKKSFWKYWTSTRVYKEYAVTMKMVQEQWLQLKMKFLLVYYMKNFIKWEGN